MTSTRLKRRLVPKLLITQRTVGAALRPVLVTTRRYRDRFDVGDPVSQAKIYEAQLADELVVLNIDGTAIGSDVLMLDLIERLASETFMPLAVGGGVRDVDDFERLLQRGADRVTINTIALDRPDMITQAAARFGSQCVVVSIDFRTGADGQARVYRDRAATPTGRPLVDWAVDAVDRGAGELMIVDADRDGMAGGLACDLARQVTDAVTVPVTLGGGCGLAEHFVDGFVRGGVDAVTAGTFFCFRDQSPMQTRAHIRNAGVPIRMET